LDATKNGRIFRIERRFGFEYNGMVLYEYYFENMKNAGHRRSNRRFSI